jgi:uncharacterized membrane protein
MTMFFFNIKPEVIFSILTVSSVAIFSVTWFLLNVSYNKASGKWPFFNRVMEKAKRKLETPLVKKYGLVGLALLMAIPLPTTGVFGGTLLSWLMGMKWWSSLIAVVLGATVSNSIVLLSVLGIIEAIS